MNKTMLIASMLSVAACTSAVSEENFTTSSTGNTTDSLNISNVQAAPKEPEVTFKKFRTIKLHSSQVIRLTGVVDNRIDNLISRLNKMNDDSKISSIYLLIDSPGGSVMDGARFVSAMEASKKPIYTVCMSLCASMAAVIHQYGTKRLMIDRSTLMFHDASGGFEGTLPQMQARLNYVTGIVNKMDGFIAKRAHTTLPKFLQAIQSEIWVDSDDAVTRHFDDEIVYVYVDDEQVSSGNIFPSEDQFKKFDLDLI